MIRLRGTGLLADDLYLIAHHDVTGKPFVQPRALGIGLAAGLLAELVLAGAIRVTAGQVAPTGHGSPADGLGQHVLTLLDGSRPLGDWLAFLSITSAPAVARRLERAGYLTPVGSRLPWRGARWMPVSSDCAFAPLIQVRVALDPARNPATSEVVLSGLAAATGLGPRILQFGPPGARGRLDEAIRRLHPDFRELIAQTQAAVDTAVLSHRM